jgi:Protein of unknown function (DUF1566)
MNSAFRISHSPFRFILHPFDKFWAGSSAFILSLLLLSTCLFSSCMDWSDDRWDDTDDDDDYIDPNPLNDNEDGTATDALTDLMWQVEPTGDYMYWDDAVDHCEGLSFAGYSDWRLPTISELRTLIRGCSAIETGGSCGVTDICLDESCQDSSCDCFSREGPAVGCYWPAEINGECFYHWSSSAVADLDHYAWRVGFVGATLNSGYVNGTDIARCVR